MIEIRDRIIFVFYPGLPHMLILVQPRPIWLVVMWPQILYSWLFSWGVNFNLEITKYSTHIYDRLHVLYNIKQTSAKSNFTMVLFRYLHPVDNALDPQGPLSQAILHAVINKVNMELKKADAITQKRGPYLREKVLARSQVRKHEWRLCCC